MEIDGLKSGQFFMWVGASPPGNVAISANAAYFLSWERRRLGGSLLKKPKKDQYRIFYSEIAIASSRPAGRRRSQDVMKAKNMRP
jgi:hypothetical protein